jgi:L-ascorbate metabolism protein UlaG (beta-lactamase superfamily)
MKRIKERPFWQRRIKKRLEQQRKLRFMHAAVRSGLRRYPRDILQSLLEEPEAATASAASIKHIEEHSLAAVWLGHGSVLARLGDTNILIDPVFSQRIGKRVGKRSLGVRRMSEAPVTCEGLPQIDIVLITHAHFDHLDKPSLQQLANTQTTVVTAPGMRRLIPPGFGAVMELAATGHSIVHGLSLSAIEPAHWGARGVLDKHRKYNSYLVRSESGSILFAGDTAYTKVFNDLEKVDLAVFGIGSYDPWENMHATPEQVWKMFRKMDAQLLLPIHHSTFQLSDEPVEEPMRRLLLAAGHRHERIIQVNPGDIWKPS